MIPVLLSLIMLTACGLSRKTATYDIKKPTNGKHHAIIHIKSDKGGVCSAFVIDDTTALTAGHCIVVDEYQKKQAIKETKKQIAEIEKEVDKLKLRKDMQAGFMLMQLTMALQQLYQDLEMAKQSQFDIDTFKVETIGGKDIKVKAKARFKHKRRDYGIIKGDFKKFNKLKVKSGFDVESLDVLRSCGYPGIADVPKCIDFTAMNQMGFSYMGRSMIVPGMSGGPVIDADGYVVGINSSVLKSFSIMEPTIGIVK